jgi:fructose-1,6-bisphosphatase I
MTDLNHFIHDLPTEDSGLGRVLGDLAAACIEISSAIDRAPLKGTLGNQGEQNVQGEQQKKLDVITNELFLEHAGRSGLVAGLVSEEMEAPVILRDAANDPEPAPYLVLFDPLDGSSNVDANISVGTIFSIMRVSQQGQALTPESFLQPGTQQICAGYAIYGASTMLVLTVGHGVQGFTLDREAGQFQLTHANMQIMPETQEFAVNMSNYRFWESAMQHYIDDCLVGKEGRRGKDFNMRWIASMVAEIHRILIRGGIFMYPMDSKIRKQGGRIRLMYEANPMSFIVEQAGGSATTGRLRIMDIRPQDLHQRVPVIMGSRNEVETVGRYHA